MAIKQLQITNLRNIPSQKISLSSRVNIFYGLNGSGKTSILEAVHLLGLARSFRTTKYKHYVSRDTSDCTLHAVIGAQSGGVDLAVGFQRRYSGELRLRIAGNDVNAISSLAELLPIQLINSDAFLLLEGSPSIRRQFLDWGGFHAESRFLSSWKAVKRCIKQRNSLLKYGKINAPIRRAWDHELINRSQELDVYRSAYVQQLIPCFLDLLGELIDLPGLSVDYYRGWDSKRSLDEVLEQSFLRDVALGFTQQGPQRADLRIKVGGIAASEVLSRGQQKLVVSAFKIAQGFLLQQLTGRSCLFLVDDLPSELDLTHRRKLCQLLERLACQMLITCVEPDAFSGCWSDDMTPQVFHVEHGSLV